MSTFAVLITAYNEEKYLGQALSSIKNQVGLPTPFAIIVVDNASTDKTSDIAKEHGAIVVSEPQKGIAYALKAGYDYVISEGYDWVIQTDADSAVSNHWVASVVKVMDDPDIVGATGPTYFYDNSPIVKFFSGGVFAVFVWVQRLLTGTMQFVGSNMAMRLSTYQQIGGVDMSFQISADVDLSKRMQKVGKIAYLLDMKVGVSSRRFKKQPLRALIYMHGGLPIQFAINPVQ